MSCGEVKGPVTGRSLPVTSDNSEACTTLSPLRFLNCPDYKEEWTCAFRKMSAPADLPVRSFPSLLHLNQGQQEKHWDRREDTCESFQAITKQHCEKQSESRCADVLKVQRHTKQATPYFLTID
ncbi:hypothetical protein STEG23_002331 [Scotinomys teguina]